MNRAIEIELRAPEHSPDWAGLHRILPRFRRRLLGISDGDVLNRHQTMIAATFLLARPDLTSYFLKGMHFEFPSYETAGTRFDRPGTMISLLMRGIRLALANKVPGNIELDIFAAQFENNQFRYEYANPKKASLSGANLLSRSHLHARERTAYKLVNHRNERVNVGMILKGILTLNPHIFSDGLPSSLFNIFRYHDHRKGMIFEIQDGKKVLLLQTCNFDQPLHLDCCLVITDPKIISTFENLFSQEIPQNEIITGNGWKVYQDGCYDLNPAKPVDSSPILSRVREILLDPETQTLSWCSQFLPDTEDLKIMEKRLKTNSIELIEIFAPDIQNWKTLYKIAGGLQSWHEIQKLQKRFPDRFKVVCSNEYVHAKLLVVNGKSLIITSHNFNRSLVQARTSETALEIHQMQPNTKHGIEVFLEQIRETAITNKH